MAVYAYAEAFQWLGDFEREKDTSYCQACEICVALLLNS